MAGAESARAGRRVAAGVGWSWPCAPDDRCVCPGPGGVPAGLRAGRDRSADRKPGAGGGVRPGTCQPAGRAGVPGRSRWRC